MSYPAFAELMRINPLSLRLRQAEVMDELCLGIAIRNGFDTVEIEFCEFFGRNLPALRTIPYRVESVWCPLGQMVVEKYPYRDEFPADVMERCRKVMLDVMWEKRIDLGFVGLREPIEERGLQFLPIASYETVAAVSKNHPLAKETAIQLKKLKPMFFIGMSEGSYPGYRQWLTDTCRRAGFAPKVLQDVEIERTLIHAVAAGLGVALLPAQAKRLPHEDVVFRELRPAVETESCIAWAADNPSTALHA